LQTDISYKKIWKIAYPIILGSIAQNIINVTDTAFLGRLGEVELGAGAIAGIFYLTLVTIGWGFGIGLQIIVARRHGENNIKAIGRIIDHGLYFLVTIALLMFAVYQWKGAEIFSRILDSQAVGQASAEYLNIRIFGLLFAFINVAFRAFYVGIGRTKVITYTTLVMAIVNVGLDFVLVFGKLGFPAMGIRGAALASLIAEISALAFFIIYTQLYYKPKKYQLFYFKQVDIDLFKRIFKVATPTMLQNFISFFGWFIFFLFVENLGERPLAVSNIIRSLYVLLMIPIMGFASAANTLVSFVIGRKQIELVMPVIRRIIVLCASGVSVLVLAGLFFPESLISIYTNDIELIKACVPSYYVISGAAILIGIGFILFNGVSGTGRTDVSLFMEIIIISIYLALTWFLANMQNVQIHQVWAVEYLYAISLSVLSFIYLKTGRWKKAEI